MKKGEFMLQFVLNCAGKMNGAEAAQEALMAWDSIHKSCIKEEDQRQIDKPILDQLESTIALWIKPKLITENRYIIGVVTGHNEAIETVLSYITKMREE